MFWNNESEKKLSQNNRYDIWRDIIFMFLSSGSYSHLGSRCQTFYNAWWSLSPVSRRKFASYVLGSIPVEFTVPYRCLNDTFESWDRCQNKIGAPGWDCESSVDLVMTSPYKDELNDLLLHAEALWVNMFGDLTEMNDNTNEKDNFDNDSKRRSESSKAAPQAKSSLTIRQAESDPTVPRTSLPNSTTIGQQKTVIPDTNQVADEQKQPDCHELSKSQIKGECIDSSATPSNAEDSAPGTPESMETECGYFSGSPDSGFTSPCGVTFEVSVDFSLSSDERHREGETACNISNNLDASVSNHSNLLRSSPVSEDETMGPNENPVLAKDKKSDTLHVADEDNEELSKVTTNGIDFSITPPGNVDMIHDNNDCHESKALLGEKHTSLDDTKHLPLSLNDQIDSKNDEIGFPDFSKDIVADELCIANKSDMVCSAMVHAKCHGSDATDVPTDMPSVSLAVPHPMVQVELDTLEEVGPPRMEDATCIDAVSDKDSMSCDFGHVLPQTKTGEDDCSHKSECGECKFQEGSSGELTESILTECEEVFQTIKFTVGLLLQNASKD